MIEPVELPEALIEHNPWSSKSNPVWTATVFQCRRNLANSNFPHTLPTEELIRLFHLVEQPLTEFFGPNRCKILPADHLSSLNKNFLSEHFLFQEDFANVEAGKGFVIDNEGLFFGLINVKDHLCLQWIDVSDCWERTWKELSTCEEALEKKFSFSFAPQFGFLTSNPANCGTALTLSAYLHIPALHHMHALASFLPSLEDVEIVGLGDTKEELVADYLVIKNSSTLGLSEQDILRSVHVAATKIASAEQGLRIQLKNEKNSLIRDLVARAYGLLTHSYQLSTKETLSFLSLIKLGLDLGWVTGLSLEAINHLFLSVRRAHLLKTLGHKEETATDLHHERASFLHTKLKNLQLQDSD